MSYHQASPVTIRRALLSVSEKAYLEELAKAFVGLGIEIIATGGTAATLKKAGIPFRPIEEFTGNPEAFDGRMKTLSFKLESAILYDRSNSTHVAQASELNIEPIDCVVCNFYPFEEALARGSNEEELIDWIDVGGPTMVRAAAKNFKSVLVLVDPSDYSEVLSEMRRLSGGVSFDTRRKMMVKAFEKVAAYDQTIFEAFAKKQLRYGENPHQAGFFIPENKNSGIQWELIEATDVELSYNNILDSHAAFGVMREAKSIAPPGFGACAIIKHNNPCGLAVAATVEEAFERAWEGDPVSSFGGVVALSSPLTFECARLFDEKFIEVLLAPGFEDGAIEYLRRKKKKLRILKTQTPEQVSLVTEKIHYQRTQVEGGYLVQQVDEGVQEEFKTVTEKKFPKDLENAGRFAVVAAKWVKSNAIAITRALPQGGFQLVGMGSGQPNRVDAIRRLAVPKAKEVISDLSACVLASDAFFPFADSIEEAHRAGIKYIVQPGGSMRDESVIAACNKLDIAMAVTGRRHFRH